MDATFAPGIVTLGEARSLGLQFYFTGTPCSRGHVEKRRVSSRACVTCENENSRASYARDPQAGYAKTRRWLAKNPEKPREYARRDREKNSAARNETSRAWRSRNIDRQNFYSAKRYAAKIAAIPEIPFGMEEMFYADIARVYENARSLSAETAAPYDVDHIFPLSKGGAHAPWNLRVLSRSANQSKKDKWPKGEPERVVWRGQSVCRLVGTNKE